MKKVRNSNLGSYLGLRGQSPYPEEDPSSYGNMDSTYPGIISYKNLYDIDTSKPHSLLLGIVDGMQHMDNPLTSNCFDIMYIYMEFLQKWENQVKEV